MLGIAAVGIVCAEVGDPIYRSLGADAVSLLRHRPTQPAAGLIMLAAGLIFACRLTETMRLRLQIVIAHSAAVGVELGVTRVARALAFIPAVRYLLCLPGGGRSHQKREYEQL